jgi:hypothetical protein
MVPEVARRYNPAACVKDMRTARGRLMGSPLAALVAVALCTPVPLAAAAQKAPRPPSCKKIRDAVWAGRTLDQIIAEFETDAHYVMKCTQKPGKRRAAPKARGKKSSKSGAKSGGSKTTSSKARSQSPPSVQRPSSRRAAPQHLP